VLGKPIYGYYLAMLGFWSLAIFNNWAGIHHLIGGPVPAWVISASIAASLMMVIPVVVTAINFHMTMVGSFAALRHSPTLRFVVFGAVNYTLVSLTGSTMAIRSVNKITHFTHFTDGHAHQGMYAFFTMVMFGAIYYILPRMLLKKWPSATLIRTHFWAAAIGVTLYWVDLEIGGWIQGLQMNDSNIPFIEVIQNTIPYLYVGSVAGIVMTIGHLAFAANIVWMLCGRGPDGVAMPTLFRRPSAIPAVSAR
jgi:cytochrome c oxidase cbb3-type subunit 1